MSISVWLSAAARPLSVWAYSSCRPLDERPKHKTKIVTQARCDPAVLQRQLMLLMTDLHCHACRQDKGSSREKQGEKGRTRLPW